MVASVSVVVPCHNYARFLPRLFGALAAQDFPRERTEIVLADDGSTDDSVAVAERLLPGLGAARSALLRLSHGGRPGRTRNEGLAAASGDYAVCLDPDDEPLPGFLAALAGALDAGADVAYPDYEEVEADGTARAVRLPEFDPGLLRIQNILAPTAMFRRAALARTRGFRANTDYEDWDLWVQMAQAGCVFRRVGAVLFRHHWHGGNFSHLAQANDGRAKAHLVRNTRRFFSPETGRWADALLRGEPWAAPFGRGLIPRAEDVKRLETLVRETTKGFPRA
ncbi:glycosyl transferase family 2 [Alkalidesulfovibrio alkalitolerans DSM 16529]|uniref:Glycosyl transferase family 2 n=1 Tax=Alkalidesulfovibrio alkalitolerans DSM 16529 TaxID=1121439 RepID=S7T5W4_9BACT|nr:glycosyltransferase family A protein [Alkalidesulfovibrio alkalitolerans]EPR32437.1 glycosyl transferase family 2 [Alkalidesulfovibrio alkalitolerans DSM 16529]